jgi:hypothetical protein
MMFKPAPSSGGPSPNAMMQKDGITIGFGIVSDFNQFLAHTQFVANFVDFDMNIQAAMDAALFLRRMCF